MPSPENHAIINLDMRVDMIRFSSDKMERLRQDTRNDPALNQLQEIIIHGWPEQARDLPTDLRSFWSVRDLLSVENGLVLKVPSTQWLIVADYYSKFPIVRKLPNPSPSSTVVSITKQIFAEMGIPDRVISDNGPHYSSEIYKAFAQTWDFDHITTSPKNISDQKK